jgi:2-desacetyl-2-hydroxyethyl bacteriochlorophyllide A dehydrogenase
MRYLEVDVGRATLREGPVPDTPPGFARVRVSACGICGTDLHLLHGMVLPHGVSYPLRPGHEVAGIVEQVNGARAGVAEGDLVVLHPLWACGTCAACLRGDDPQCERGRILGIHDPGGLAESVVWPVARMLVANGLEPAGAAVLADAAATAHHALRLSGLPPGGSLCVLGAGGVGGSVLAIARALYPDARLAAVVRSDASAARIGALGVEVHRGLEGAARALRKSFDRCDAVIDFSGQAEAPAEGAALLRRGGRLVLGSVVDEPLTLGPSSAFMTRELQLVGAYTSSLRDLAAVIELARAGRIDPSGWVSARRPLSEVQDALALVESRPPGMVRVVVEMPWEETLPGGAEKPQH